MMWLFAVLLVLAMGGIALLAAGKGTPMAEVYDDRPDALVPAEGNLTGDDLRRVRFSLAFRGYRMSEVDALLERLAAQVDAPAPEHAAGPPPEHPAEHRAEHRAGHRAEDRAEDAGSGVEATPGPTDRPTSEVRGEHRGD